MLNYSLIRGFSFKFEEYISDIKGIFKEKWHIFLNDLIEFFIIIIECFIRF